MLEETSSFRSLFGSLYEKKWKREGEGRIEKSQVINDFLPLITPRLNKWLSHHHMLHPVLSLSLSLFQWCSPWCLHLSSSTTSSFFFSCHVISPNNNNVPATTPILPHSIIIGGGWSSKKERKGGRRKTTWRECDQQNCWLMIDYFSSLFSFPLNWSLLL